MDTVFYKVFEFISTCTEYFFFLRVMFIFDEVNIFIEYSLKKKAVRRVTAIKIDILLKEYLHIFYFLKY